MSHNVAVVAFISFWALVAVCITVTSVAKWVALSRMWVAFYENTDAGIEILPPRYNWSSIDYEIKNGTYQTGDADEYYRNRNKGDE